MSQPVSPVPAVPPRRAYILKERFIAQSEARSRSGAIWNDRTQAVACAITAGHSILPKGFARVIEADRPDTTTVTFCLEERPRVEFEAFAGETIDTPTLMARLADVEWIKANPTHPIAYAYWAIKNYAALVKAIKTHAPLMMFQRGRNKAYVVVGGDVEKNRFVLERAKFNAEEIAEILAHVGPPEASAA